MNSFYQAALQKLGLAQQSYKSTFAEGSSGHATLVDLALYSRAFQADVDGLTHDQVMQMHGRRQMFFRIFQNVKLSNLELEAVCRNALIEAANRYQRQQGATE